MRTYWSQVPMLRVAIALITGISLWILLNAYHLADYRAMLTAAAISALSLVFLFALAFIKNTTLLFKLKIYQGAATVIAIISLGFILSWFYAQNNATSHFSHCLADRNVLLVQIDEPPVVHEKVFLATGLVKEISNQKLHLQTNGRIQLIVMRDSTTPSLKYGDVLLVNSKVEETDGPKNPEEFSFKRYQAFHNIYHKAFLNTGEWQVVDSARGNKLLSSIYIIRDDFLQLIKQYVKDTNDFGVASAIMLGYRDYTNADIMRAYSSSGTIHVLSVSGLHVGIMFFMLNFLLQWMDKRGRNWVIAKALFIILFIWFYACLTGLSPPVLRSAMMFTLIQGGTVMIRNVNMYNVIAASAVLILLFNPFVLTDVGFQLSYLAVLGIVYLQPKVAALWIAPVPKNAALKNAKSWLAKCVAVATSPSWTFWKLADATWQLIAVSLAAQLVTLPLTLFYFNQFPNLFLFSNLIVIPISNLVLFAGTGLFAVAHIPYIGKVVGITFNALVHWLNLFIFWIDSLPFALTKGIWLSTFELTLLFFLLFLFGWLTEERRTKVLIASLTLIVVLCSFHSWRSINNRFKQELIVYDVPKLKAIAFINDRKVYCDFDSALINDKQAMSFHINRHWYKSGIESVNSLHTIQSPYGKIAVLEGKKILIADTAIARNIAIPVRLNVDLIIISGNPKLSIPTLMQVVDCKLIVFDSSNKLWNVNRWVQDCNLQGIRYWDVRAMGVYILPLHN